jgi:hypothetical protein
MKWISLFFVLLVFKVNSIELNKNNLEAFSKEYGDIVLKSFKESFDYLSNDLTVETHIGSTVRGITLFYDKAGYIQLMLSVPFEAPTDLETDVFGFKITSPSTGEFTVTQYSEIARSKVWSTYFVRVIKEKIKITKIIDSAN